MSVTKMTRILAFCGLALALAVAPAAASGTSASFYAQQTSAVSSGGNNATFSSSLQSGTTFGLYESEYDFFFMPWETPDIDLTRSGRLGNNNDGGDYKALYWSQLSNTGNPFGPPSSSSIDVLNASILMPAGPGYLGISAAWGTDEFTSGSEANNTTDETSVSELYVSWGQRKSDDLAWGIGLNITDATNEFSNNTGTIDSEDEASDISVTGGVKWHQNDDRWWTFYGKLGSPTVESSSLGGNSDELDGSSIGLGASVNLVRDGYDLEFEAAISMDDWDAEDIVSGVNQIADNDLTEDSFTISGRAYYELGKAELWKGITIGSTSLESEVMPTSGIGSVFEQDSFIFRPAAGFRFPIRKGIHVIGGAAYTMSEIETEDANLGSPAFSISENTNGDTDYRLGLEFVGERFAVDVQWENGGTSGGRQTIDNDSITVGGTFKM